jgi:hypothetical protein
MKAQAKHTPGPWNTEDRRYLITDAPDEGNVGIYDCNGLWLADVHGAHVGPKNRADVDANVRLIAAAPELLEALERVTGWFQQFQAAQRSGGNIVELLQNVDLSAAVRTISKAKGTL